MIRSICGVGYGLLGLIEELRESRQVIVPRSDHGEPVIVQCECSGIEMVPPALEPVPDRAARGQAAFTIVVLAGVIVLLVVLCIVLALT